MPGRPVPSHADVWTYKLTWAEIVKLYRLTLPEEPPERPRFDAGLSPYPIKGLLRQVFNRLPDPRCHCLRRRLRSQKMAASPARPS